MHGAHKSGVHTSSGSCLQRDMLCRDSALSPPQAAAHAHPVIATTLLASARKRRLEVSHLQTPEHCQHNVCSPFAAQAASLAAIAALLSRTVSEKSMIVSNVQASAACTRCCFCQSLVATERWPTRRPRGPSRKQRILGPTRFSRQ